MQTKSILALITVVSQATAYPLESLVARIIGPRAVIGHDQVTPFAETESV